MKKCRTSDLYYSAFLKTAGVPMLGTEREGSKVFFIFEDAGTLDELKRDYFNRKAKVDALSYADEIKAMKALTFI